MSIGIREEFLSYIKPSDHSPYGPSSYDRWRKGACPASIRLSEGIVLPRQKYSDEGTLAHSVCEAVFREEFFSIPFPSKLRTEMDFWEMENPGGTAPMLQHAYEYSNVIKNWMDESKIGKLIFLGLEKSIPVIKEKNVYGTGDCIIIGSKACVVIDYKYGRGKLVKGDAPQLQVYAVGVWRYLLNLPEDYLFHTIVFQPRVSPIESSASFDVNHMQMMFNEIWESVEESKNPNNQPNKGDHCFWCPASRTTDPLKKCRAIKDNVFEVVEGDLYDLLKKTSGEIPALDMEYERKRNKAVAELLSISDFIIDTITSLKEEYTERILAGETFEGLQLEEEVGNRTYYIDDPIKMAKELKEKFPQLEPFKEIPATKKLKTITEVEKELKIKDGLAGLTVRKVKKKLVADDKEVTSRLSTMLGLS